MDDKATFKSALKATPVGVPMRPRELTRNRRQIVNYLHDPNSPMRANKPESSGELTVFGYQFEAAELFWAS